jgi:hypothetical protein
MSFDIVSILSLLSRPSTVGAGDRTDIGGAVDSSS